MIGEVPLAIREYMQPFMTVCVGVGIDREVVYFIFNIMSCSVYVLYVPSLQAAFGHAKEKGLKVILTCTYLQHYVTKHPEHVDIILK